MENLHQNLVDLNSLSLCDLGNRHLLTMQNIFINRKSGSLCLFNLNIHVNLRSSRIDALNSVAHPCW